MVGRRLLTFLLATTTALLSGLTSSAALSQAAAATPAPAPVHRNHYVNGHPVVQKFTARRLRPVATAPPSVSTSPSPTAPTTRRAVSELKIMNYYPSDAAWTYMWSNYSHERTAADLAAIAGLGANTVRVIVQTEPVGWPNVTSTGHAAFNDMLATARATGLSVQLTLFDWWNGYPEVAKSKAWLAQLLAGHANDPTIALVELQNEIPTDNSAAMAWAHELLPALAAALPGVPRTLSASGASGRAGMVALASLPATEVEVVDVHFYGRAAAALPFLKQAQALAAGRPVIVGETGLSTIGAGGTEEAQATFYRLMAMATRAAGIQASAPWTLSDFTVPGVPNTPAPNEYKFGLRRLDGTWKPAAAVVRAAFGDGNVVDWDGGFERAVNGDVLGAWRAYDVADGRAVVAQDVVRSGARSVCFSGTGSSASAVPSIIQDFPVLTAGQRVSLQAHVRRSAPGGLERVALAWFTADGSYLGTAQSPAASQVGTWEQLSVSASAPAGAAWGELHLKAADEAGRACYDDVSVALG